MTTQVIDGTTYPVVFHSPNRVLGCPACYQVGFHYYGTICTRQGRAILDRIGTAVPDPHFDEALEWGPRCTGHGQRGNDARCAFCES